MATPPLPASSASTLAANDHFLPKREHSDLLMLQAVDLAMVVVASAPAAAASSQLTSASFDAAPKPSPEAQLQQPEQPPGAAAASATPSPEQSKLFTRADGSTMQLQYRTAEQCQSATFAQVIDEIRAQGFDLLPRLKELVEARGHQWLSGCSDPSGWRVEHYAAMHSVQTLRLLHDRNCQINRATGTEAFMVPAGGTGLHVAVVHKQLEAVRFFLETGDADFVGHQNLQGSTAHQLLTGMPQHEAMPFYELFHAYDEHQQQQQQQQQQTLPQQQLDEHKGQESSQLRDDDVAETSTCPHSAMQLPTPSSPASSSSAPHSASIINAATKLGGLAAASAGGSTVPSPASKSVSAQGQVQHSSDEGRRVADLLLYYYDLSDHVVRENTQGWEHAGLGGILVSEWQPESSRYRIPCSLLWAYDGQAASARNDDSSLPKYSVDMPLLPYWTLSVEGDGDCLMRALILGDVAAKSEDLKVPIWDTMLSLERDAVWGLTTDRTAERTALTKYRETFVQQSPSMSPSLGSLVGTIGKRPPILEVLPFAASFHQQHVRLAGFDRVHQEWPWERSYPRGVIELEDDKLSPLEHEAPQSSQSRMVLLQYLEGLRWLPSYPASGKSGAAKPASVPAASSTGLGSLDAGHVQPLIPAPNFLLCGPSHPLYPMEPAVWIPFGAVANCTHFITPYHRGLFGTSWEYADPGSVLLSDSRKPLFPLTREPGEFGEQPFVGAVYYGTVVSYFVAHEGVKSLEQGAVVLTYVRQHNALGPQLQTMLARGEANGEASSALVTASKAMPTHGPVPYLCVLPFSLHPEAGADTDEAPPQGSLDGTMCWQHLSGSPIVHIRSADVQRIWHESELGTWSQLAKGEKKLPPLRHRTEVASRPVDLVNPAQPTRLRKELNDHPVLPLQEYLLTTASSMGAGKASSGRDFLESIRAVAEAGFPVSVLLTVRAGINCARALARPGHLEPTSAEFAHFHSAPMPKLASIAVAAAAATPPTVATPAASPSTPCAKPPSSRSAAIAASAALKTTIAPDDDPQPPRAARSRTPAKRSTRASEQPVTPAPSVKSSSSSPHRVAGSTHSVSSQDDSDHDSVHDNAADAADAQSEWLPGAIKSLFLTLADETVDESRAPLAAIVWNNWLLSSKYKAGLTGAALANALLPWKNELYKTLCEGELDDQLHAFLTDHARDSTDLPTVAGLLAQSKGKGSWRNSYRQHNKCRSDVRMLWAFNEGVQPEQGCGSVQQMHVNNRWYGKPASAPASTKAKALTPSKAAATKSAKAAPAKPAPKPARAPFKASSSKRSRASSSDEASESHSPPPIDRSSAAALSSKRDRRGNLPKRRAGAMQAERSAAEKSDDMLQEAPPSRVRTRTAASPAAANPSLDVGEQATPSTKRAKRAAPEPTPGSASSQTSTPAAMLTVATTLQPQAATTAVAAAPAAPSAVLTVATTLQPQAAATAVAAAPAAPSAAPAVPSATLPAAVAPVAVPIAALAAAPSTATSSELGASIAAMVEMVQSNQVMAQQFMQTTERQSQAFMDTTSRMQQRAVQSSQQQMQMMMMMMGQQQQPQQPFMFGGARLGSMPQMLGVPQFPMLSAMPGGFASMAMAGGGESDYESDQDVSMQQALVPANAAAAASSRGGQAPAPAAILQHMATQQALIAQLVMAQQQGAPPSSSSSSSSSNPRGGRPSSSARRGNGLGGGFGGSVFGGGFGGSGFNG